MMTNESPGNNKSGEIYDFNDAMCDAMMLVNEIFTLFVLDSL